MDTRAIQWALMAAGHKLPRFGADGAFGAETRAAMQEFQRSKGLPVSAAPDAATIAALQASIAERRPPALADPSPGVTVGLLTALAKACGARANPAIVAGIADNASWILAGGIDTPPRLAEFLAQACLETDHFRVLEEYASGAAYEDRRDLGNLVTGDGRRFKGRGIFQCTGRANYTAFGKRLGIDLLKDPALAARPDISVRIAVLYWNDSGLSAFADRGDTAAISRAINRGDPHARKPANHEADRIRIAQQARLLLAV